MKRLLLFLLLLIPTHAQEQAPPAQTPTYAFKGSHYFASYYGCDAEAINNHIYLVAYFVKAIDKSGAELLKITKHVFPNGAISIAAVLSESHAAIHTYPEFNAVFVDLFTCGDHCDWRAFEEVMKEYLKVDKVHRKVRVRK